MGGFSAKFDAIFQQLLKLFLAGFWELFQVGFGAEIREKQWSFGAGTRSVFGGCFSLIFVGV